MENKEEINMAGKMWTIIERAFEKLEYSWTRFVAERNCMIRSGACITEARKYWDTVLCCLENANLCQDKREMKEFVLEASRQFKRKIWNIACSKGYDVSLLIGWTEVKCEVEGLDLLYKKINIQHLMGKGKEYLIKSWRRLLLSTSEL
jgi:hypothetical protein